MVTDPAVLLSDRELDVLALLRNLLTAWDIADDFTISVNTVKSHVRTTYAELGLSSGSDAVARAHRRAAAIGSRHGADANRTAASGHLGVLWDPARPLTGRCTATTCSGR